MKYLYFAAALALTGCMSPRTCELRTQREVGKVLLEDQQDAKEAVDRVNVGWELTTYMFTRQFCSIIINDQLRIAKLTKKNNVRLPNICGPMYEELLKKEK